MKKIFKETELDKISNELVNQIVPFETLNNYYRLGVANALNSISNFVDTYKGEFNKEELKQLVIHLTNDDKVISDYYSRLQKDQ